MSRDQTTIGFGQEGFGLMIALFVVVLLGVFGLLVARFTTTTNVASVEDHLWNQAVFAAETAAQRVILFQDGGGGGGYPGDPVVAGFATTVTPPFPALPAPGNPVSIRVTATAPAGTTEPVARTIELKYLL